MDPAAETSTNGRQARGLVFSALAIVALGWALFANDTTTGRGPGRGDVAGGLENLDDLLMLALLGVLGVVAAILTFIARRRAPESLLVTAAQSLSVGTVAMSIVLMVRAFLA